MQHCRDICETDVQNQCYEKKRRKSGNPQFFCICNDFHSVLFLAKLLARKLFSKLNITWHGFLFVQICESVNKWELKWDDQQKVPYGCNGNQWVGFDDIRSILIKVRNMQIN
jgi:hypothetical protein